MTENNIKIKTYDGFINTVDNSTQKAVKNAIDKINSIFTSNVFEDVTIHIASDYSNLPSTGSKLNNYLKTEESSLYAILGTTSDDFECKEIFIQESAFWLKKLSNLFSSRISFSANNEIELSALHEFGHLFDYNGGDKELKEKAQKVYDKYENIIDKLLPEDDKIMHEYFKNNGYSDKEDFKNAILEDLKALNLTPEIAKKYKHELIGFYNNGLDIVSSIEYIENAETSRSELFAQLFSYILGGEDDKKDEIMKIFTNTSQVVKRYIESSKK